MKEEIAEIVESTIIKNTKSLIYKKDIALVIETAADDAVFTPTLPESSCDSGSSCDTGDA